MEIRVKFQDDLVSGLELFRFAAASYESARGSTIAELRPVIRRYAEMLRYGRISGGNQKDWKLNRWDTERAWDPKKDLNLPQPSAITKGTHFARWLLAQCRKEASETPPAKSHVFIDPRPQDASGPTVPEFTLLGCEVNLRVPAKHNWVEHGHEGGVNADGLAALRDGSLASVEIKGPGDADDDQEWVERPITQALCAAIPIYMRQHELVEIVSNTCPFGKSA